MRIRTGDTVYHRPTGETWLVAYVEDDGRYLAPCGWPFCLAPVTDCELREAASDEDSMKLLRELAEMSDQTDMRQRHAAGKLADATQTKSTEGGRDGT